MKRSLDLPHVKAAEDALTIAALTAEVKSLKNTVSLLIVHRGKVNHQVSSSIKRYKQLKDLSTRPNEHRTSSTKQHMQLEADLNAALSKANEHRQALAAVSEENIRLRQQIDELTKSSTTKAEARSSENTIESLQAMLRNSQELQEQQKGT